MPRKRQARKCSGKRTDGNPCNGWAINGGTVCGAHGGKAPQVKAKARENLEDARVERLLYQYGADPCGDPIGALQRLIGRALSIEEALGAKVNELTSIRYESETGGQLRAEVAMLERAMDRAGRLLVDVARLNIEERLAKVTEKQAQMAMDALAAALQEMGLNAEQQREARSRVARHLRSVS